MVKSFTARVVVWLLVFAMGGNPTHSIIDYSFIRMLHNISRSDSFAISFSLYIWGPQYFSLLRTTFPHARTPHFDVVPSYLQRRESPIFFWDSGSSKALLISQCSWAIRRAESYVYGQRLIQSVPHAWLWHGIRVKSPPCLIDHWHIAKVLHGQSLVIIEEAFFSA